MATGKDCEQSVVASNLDVATQLTFKRSILSVYQILLANDPRNLSKMKRKEILSFYCCQHVTMRRRRELRYCFVTS